jgi:hypothetical protein
MILGEFEGHWSFKIQKTVSTRLFSGWTISLNQFFSEAHILKEMRCSGKSAKTL